MNADVIWQAKVPPICRDGLDRPVSCLLYRTLCFCFVFSLTVSDVQYNQETSVCKFPPFKLQTSLWCFVGKESNENSLVCWRGETLHSAVLLLQDPAGLWITVVSWEDSLNGLVFGFLLVSLQFLLYEKDSFLCTTMKYLFWDK